MKCDVKLAAGKNEGDVYLFCNVSYFVGVVLINIESHKFYCGILYIYICIKYIILCSYCFPFSTASINIHVPLEVNNNKMFPALGIDKDFLEMILMTQEIISRINKQHYIRLKGWTAKKILNRMMRQSTEWERDLGQLYIRQVIHF